MGSHNIISMPAAVYMQNYSLLKAKGVHYLTSILFRKLKTTQINFLMMTEERVRGYLMITCTPVKTSASPLPLPLTKLSQLSQPVPWDTVTSRTITAQFMAGAGDQDSRLSPVSTDKMQSWIEVNTKPAHFADVVAASCIFESQQLVPLPHCHMLINPHHSGPIRSDRCILVLAASVHNQQEWRACFNLQGCKTHSMKQASGEWFHFTPEETAFMNEMASWNNRARSKLGNKIKSFNFLSVALLSLSLQGTFTADLLPRDFFTMWI